jgi:hypothetical protein
MMRIFPLFAFTDGYLTVITRGENEDQAMSYACRSSGQFKRGVTVSSTYLPIDANKLYNSNHKEGWLYRKPFWLEKAEQQQAVDLGYERILELISSKSTLQPLTYQES